MPFFLSFLSFFLLLDDLPLEEPLPLSFPEPEPLPLLLPFPLLFPLPLLSPLPFPLPLFFPDGFELELLLEPKELEELEGFDELDAVTWLDDELEGFEEELLVV